MKAIERQKAITLRKEGYSLNEIRERVSASKSSISLWVRNVYLSKDAQSRIEKRMTNGQIASRLSKRYQTSLREQQAVKIAQKTIKGLHFGKEYKKILTALVYYCEGTKDVRRGLMFTNSDPGLVASFMSLLRQSFSLDERKFRACVHLHSYHIKNKQLKFWSKTSNIPVQQFIKPYQKKNSGLYKKDGYQGCISIRYGDVRIARELKALAIGFMNKGL